MARGDRVTAVVRDPGRAESLAALGVDIRQGDLSRTAAIVDAMRGTDAAIHLAGMYRVGIPASERPAMHDANVGTTHRVLDAFATAGLDRMVASRRSTWPATPTAASSTSATGATWARAS